MKGVCIVGGSKSGTTGLYSSVRAGILEHEPRCYGMHEKYDLQTYKNLGRLGASVPVVAKLLLTNRNFSPEIPALFDQRVLIVRDPRDILVSAALYYPILAINDGAGDETVDDYIAKVREKEADPDSHAFLDLLVAGARLMRPKADRSSDFMRRFRVTQEYLEQESPFKVHYEDFVRDELSQLSDHVGFEVRNTRPSEYSSVVVRSAGAGDWRRWFTADDVEHFRPLMGEYLNSFGYQDDWELDGNPEIRPEEGSGYIDRSRRKRREQLSINQGPLHDDVQQVEQLRDRADDGAHGAARKLATVLLSADPANHHSEIVERLEFAAATGSTGAMRNLADVLDGRHDEPRNTDAARFWRAEADIEEERQLLHRAHAKRAARIKELEEERQQLRRANAKHDARLKELEERQQVADAKLATAHKQLAEIHASRRYRMAGLLTGPARGRSGRRISDIARVAGFISKRRGLQRRTVPGGRSGS